MQGEPERIAGARERTLGEHRAALLSPVPVSRGHRAAGIHSGPVQARDVSVRDTNVASMQLSTVALALGAGLFVLPIPGTFVTGALLLLAGAVARWQGT